MFFYLRSQGIWTIEIEFLIDGAYMELRCIVIERCQQHLCQ